MLVFCPKHYSSHSKDLRKLINSGVSRISRRSIPGSDIRDGRPAPPRPIPVTRVSDVVKGGALSDTLGKLTSAHLARGPTPHEGWALAAVGRGGKGVAAEGEDEQ